MNLRVSQSLIVGFSFIWAYEYNSCILIRLTLSCQTFNSEVIFECKATALFGFGFILVLKVFFKRIWLTNLFVPGKLMAGRQLSLRNPLLNRKMMAKTSSLSAVFWPILSLPSPGSGMDNRCSLPTGARYVCRLVSKKHRALLLAI